MQEVGPWKFFQHKKEPFTGQEIKVKQIHYIHWQYVSINLIKDCQRQISKKQCVKSIVHVKKYASFQLYRTYFAGVFGKKYNWHQVHKQTSLIFFKSNSVIMCQEEKNNVSRRKKCELYDYGYKI